MNIIILQKQRIVLNNGVCGLFWSFATVFKINQRVYSHWHVVSPSYRNGVMSHSGCISLCLGDSAVSMTTSQYITVYICVFCSYMCVLCSLQCLNVSINFFWIKFWVEYFKFDSLTNFVSLPYRVSSCYYWFLIKTITLTSYWARLRLKSSAPRLFTQPFIQAQIK